MRLSYDLNVRALYISFSDQAVARTREIDDNTNIDLDASGAVVGIEVISIDHPWPLADILDRYEIPAGERAQLSAYFPQAVAPAAPAISIASPAPAAMVAA
jgi:uncharacterized protein YuzE